MKWLRSKLYTIRKRIPRTFDRIPSLHPELWRKTKCWLGVPGPNRCGTRSPLEDSMAILTWGLGLREVFVDRIHNDEQDVHRCLNKWKEKVSYIVPMPLFLFHFFLEIQVLQQGTIELGAWVLVISILIRNVKKAKHGMQILSHLCKSDSTYSQ